MSASSSSYRRVPQRESDDDSPQAGPFALGIESTIMRTRGERLEDKFVALVWVIWAVILARWTDFFSVLWKDERLNRTLLKVASGGFLVALSLFLYLTLYLPRIKGLSDPSVWGVYCPKVFPMMCVTVVITYLVLIRSLWPLWGFLAPFISGSEIMGIVMALHFVPTFGFC